MRLPTLIALACLPLLSACQLLGGPAGSGPAERLAPQRIAWEQQAEDCRERCSLVNVDTLQFAAQPTLDALIERALLAMAGAEAQTASLRAHADARLRAAPQGEETWLQAKLLDQHADLLVIELSSYLYSGGAHGMPGRGLINYSLGEQRALGLQDILRPGQQEAFWQAAGEAHLRWLRDQQLGSDDAFRQQWPFQPTEHIALLRDRVLLKYDVYAIAPYAMGHPSLEIPYVRLRQILREEYLPR